MSTYTEKELKSLEIARKLIIKWECGGNVDKFLNAYPDPSLAWKVPTIGIGTTVYPNGTKVKKGDKITEADAYKYLVHHIMVSTMPNLRKIPSWNELSSNKQAALISFAYNVGSFYGSNGFKTISTALKLKQYNLVANAFSLYVKSGGVTSQGLINRRTDESNLFKS